MERKKTKRTKNDLPKSIIGLNTESAKDICKADGYALKMYGETTKLHDTYIVTVVSIDENGLITEAKYGR